MRWPAASSGHEGHLWHNRGSASVLAAAPATGRQRSHCLLQRARHRNLHVLRAQLVVRVGLDTGQQLCGAGREGGVGSTVRELRQHMRCLAQACGALHRSLEEPASHPSAATSSAAAAHRS